MRTVLRRARALRVASRVVRNVHQFQHSAGRPGFALQSVSRHRREPKLVIAQRPVGIQRSDPWCLGNRQTLNRRGLMTSWQSDAIVGEKSSSASTNGATPAAQKRAVDASSANSSTSRRESRVNDRDREAPGSEGGNTGCRWWIVLVLEQWAAERRHSTEWGADKAENPGGSFEVNRSSRASEKIDL